MNILEKVIEATHYYAADEWLTATPDQLSTQRVRLAAYYSYLGEEYSKMRAEADRAEFDAKIMESESYKEYREAGKTQADAKEYARLGAGSRHREALSRQLEAKRLQQLLGGLSELLNALSSRLRNLEAERARGM